MDDCMLQPPEATGGSETEYLEYAEYINKIIAESQYKSTEISCVCVGVQVGSFVSKNIIKKVLIMEFAADDGKRLVKFFNVKETNAGNYSVPRDGDFAKLYRITFGENPVAKFSRCNRIWNAFRSHRFFANYETVCDKKGATYLRVSNIKPVDPIVRDGWTITGKLTKKCRKNTPKSRQKLTIQKCL